MKYAAIAKEEMALYSVYGCLERPLRTLYLAQSPSSQSNRCYMDTAGVLHRYEWERSPWMPVLFDTPEEAIAQAQDWTDGATQDSSYTDWLPGAAPYNPETEVIDLNSLALRGG